jgi:capsular polysaccharide export protein
MTEAVDTRVPCRVLLATLPFGRFGRDLVRAFRGAGAEVRHMVFNTGDLLSRRGPGSIRHQEGASEWPRRLAALAPAFTDILIFGESGPYNEAVLALGRAGGARVWVLENGYFRPDWVTLERGGANAGSPLPRDAEGYAAEWPEPPPPRLVGPATRSLAFNISLYYFVELYGRWLFPLHKPAFAAPPWRQAVGHTWRYFRGLLTRQPDDGAVIEAARPYFLVCLQRDGDSQLLRHSPLPDNAAFLEAVMHSFSHHAPADLDLVVKNHPLDPGLVDLEMLTAQAAHAHGVAGRVRFIDGGSLARLCKASQGLVVNNSSAAFSALGFGTPVKAKGRALFNFEGLSDQKPLDAFWTDPTPPDAGLFRRFRAQVMARTQINGSFDSPRMTRRTAAAVVEAVTKHDPD